MMINIIGNPLDNMHYCTLSNTIIIFKKKYNEVVENEKMILNFVSFIIRNKDLSEQEDKNDGSNLGAKNLIRNYSELYDLGIYSKVILLKNYTFKKSIIKVCLFFVFF